MTYDPLSPEVVYALKCKPSEPFDPIVHDGRPGGPQGLERARWKYVQDEISLEEFEHCCEIWLRWEDAQEPAKL